MSEMKDVLSVRLSKADDKEVWELELEYEKDGRANRMTWRGRREHTLIKDLIAELREIATASREGRPPEFDWKAREERRLSR